MRRAFLLLIAATALGCSGTLVDTGDLREAEARWAARGFADYQVEMRVVCFCFPELHEWSRVQVEDGAITGVWRLDGMVPVAMEQWAAWPTVEALFDRLADTPDSEVYRRVEVDYDSELGYPIRIAYIEREGVADAGVTYELRRPTAIEGPAS